MPLITLQTQQEQTFGSLFSEPVSAKNKHSETLSKVTMGRVESETRFCRCWKTRLAPMMLQTGLIPSLTRVVLYSQQLGRQPVAGSIQVIPESRLAEFLRPV